jgi:succinylarginine dihydrolase
LGRKARSIASSLGDEGAADTMRLGGGGAKSSV